MRLEFIPKWQYHAKATQRVAFCVVLSQRTRTCKFAGANLMKVSTCAELREPQQGEPNLRNPKLKPIGDGFGFLLFFGDLSWYVTIRGIVRDHRQISFFDVMPKLKTKGYLLWNTLLIQNVTESITLILNFPNIQTTLSASTPTCDFALWKSIETARLYVTSPRGLREKL